MNESRRSLKSCAEIKNAYADLIENQNVLQQRIHDVSIEQDPDRARTLLIDQVSYRQAHMEETIELLKEAIKDEYQMRLRKRFFDEYAKKFNLEYVGEFDSTGRARAKNIYGSWLVVNKQGEDVMRGERFSELSAPRDGFVVGRIRRDDQAVISYRIIKPDGTYLMDRSNGSDAYSEVQEGSDDTFLVSHGFQKTFIDREGTRVDLGGHAFFGRNTTPFSEGLAWVTTPDNTDAYMLVQRNGEYVLPSEGGFSTSYYLDQANPFHDGLSLVKAKTNGGYYYVKKDGYAAFDRWILEKATDFNKGHAWVQETAKPDPLYTDGEDEEAIPIIRQITTDGEYAVKDGKRIEVRGFIESYTDGVLKIRKDRIGLPTFVDEQGKQIASGWKADDFEEGVGRISEGSRLEASGMAHIMHYIDKKGRRVFSLE